jgi:hypothetical protein
MTEKGVTGWERYLDVNERYIRSNMLFGYLDD